MFLLMGIIKKERNFNMWKMFIDDERFPVDESFFIVRTVEQAIDIMAKKGAPNFISFDHDLGDNIPTGADLAKWLVDKDLDSNYTFLPKDFSFYVHSANPVGKKNIEGLLTQYLEYRKEFLPTEKKFKL